MEKEKNQTITVKGSAGTNRFYLICQKMDKFDQCHWTDRKSRQVSWDKNPGLKENIRDYSTIE